MATATEEVLADLVDRAVGAVGAHFSRPLAEQVTPGMKLALLPVLEEALFLGEARAALDPETAREELRHVLEEMRQAPVLFESSAAAPEEELLRQLQHRQFDDGSVIIPHDTTLRPGPNLAALFRLLWLLDLSEGERAFVRAAAEDPCDLDGLSVFADWLEEQQRVDSERFREVAQAGMKRLNPQPGEVYVIHSPPTGSTVQDDFAAAYLRGVHKRWETIGNGAALVILVAGESLSQLTDEQLAAAGLVRKDGLAEREKLGIKKHTGS